jgi:glycosyltransferase involved in cell wall biosynthesis
MTSAHVPSRPGSPPGVSVVICTFNRSALLRDALLSFGRAIRSAPPTFRCELIVVDNGSTDDTADAVSVATRDSAVPLKYVREPARGLSMARNTGVRTAKHGIVAFADDDVFVGAGWLNAIARAFADAPEICCVGGKTIPVFESGRPAWIDDDLLRFYGSTCSGEARREMRYPEHPFGVNMAARRVVFDTVGGFHPSLGRARDNLRSNEESDFFRRASAAGFRTIYEPSAVLEHRIPVERAQQRWLLSRAYWQGISDVLTRLLEAERPARSQLMRTGLAELLKLLREARGGHISPRRILWHVHGMRFESRVRYAYRLGKARQLIVSSVALRYAAPSSGGPEESRTLLS